ncbi:hypothetical protein G6F56_011862 [Rhizopus delemar]|nr:hypothetical protein G6F56_011862 [Rhizopus delemar]
MELPYEPFLYGALLVPFSKNRCPNLTVFRGPEVPYFYGFGQKLGHRYGTCAPQCQRSWARVVTKNRKSLLHSTNSYSTANMVTSTPSTLDAPMISKTSIWRTGHGSGSVFINMTGRKESKIEFLHLVAQQYPSRVGVLTQ